MRLVFDDLRVVQLADLSEQHLHEIHLEFEVYPLHEHLHETLRLLLVIRPLQQHVQIEYAVVADIVVKFGGDVGLKHE